MSLDSLRRALRHEAAAVARLADALGDHAATAVDWIVESPGKLVACGLGKSGHIARKTAATFASTGTPAQFLHAAEALHGDIGVVQPGDIVLLYSQAGETDEMVRLLPALKSLGAKTMLITGRPDSTVGRAVDLVLDTGVVEEACPNDLAPTTSTTVMLALSDALAIAVMERRGFGRDDFARYHPSGSLGRRLLLRVSDVMRSGPDFATVSPDATLLEAMRAITRAGAGAVCVVEAGRLVGFLSDGDLRRQLVSAPSDIDAPIVGIMRRSVTTVGPDLLAVDALETFQNHPVKIGEMPVVDRDGNALGILMLKDLLRAGIVL